MTSPHQDSADGLDGWREEMSSAFLYRCLAAREEGTRQTLFLDLATAAERQAGIWSDRVATSGHALPGSFIPSIRTRIVAWLIPHFNPRTLRPILAAMKVRGLSVYRGPVGATYSQEHVDEAGRHRGVSHGGNLRAAVFGVNDGLVSNASLILGVAGAGSDSRIIVLSGVAGLLAGAFSMASGEYVSVRSQREMYEHQIDLEREELNLYPQEETDELALIYAARGMSKEEAQRLAASMTSNPEQALDTLTREELGLNMDQLGSPWGAASTSLVSFAVGAAIPLLPFLIGGSEYRLGWSVGLAGAALFGVGCALSLFSGRSALLSGLRMLSIGAAAGAATYLIGTLLGVNLGN
ncbi:MAG: VIT1/CCC1 transporter family protein [Pseudomonadota bacterium]|nr:VIT1/CCC1 transporter family protein [Pseudomonadota bacterium]